MGFGVQVGIPRETVQALDSSVRPPGWSGIFQALTNPREIIEQGRRQKIAKAQEASRPYFDGVFQSLQQGDQMAAVKHYMGYLTNMYTLGVPDDAIKMVADPLFDMIKNADAQGLQELIRTRQAQFATPSTPTLESAPHDIQQAQETEQMPPPIPLQVGRTMGGRKVVEKKISLPPGGVMTQEWLGNLRSAGDITGEQFVQQSQKLREQEAAQQAIGGMQPSQVIQGGVTYKPPQETPQIPTDIPRGMMPVPVYDETGKIVKYTFRPDPDYRGEKDYRLLGGEKVPPEVYTQASTQRKAFFDAKKQIIGEVTGIKSVWNTVKAWDAQALTPYQSAQLPLELIRVMSGIGGKDLPKVRPTQGELFMNIRETRSFAEGVQAWYQNKLAGQIITPGQAQQIKDIIQGAAEETERIRLERLEDLKEEYRASAEAFGIPSLVVDSAIFGETVKKVKKKGQPAAPGTGYDLTEEEMQKLLNVGQ